MKREREMDGGLLAGTLSISVGLGRWNQAWYVCSGLVATPKRDVDISGGEEIKIINEERIGQ